MIINRFVLSVAILTLAQGVEATQSKDTLPFARESIVKRYLNNLQKADYQNMTQLFEKGGIVISTSRGKVDAKEFFYAFLPDLVSAHTELHHYFVSATDANRVAVRFHFSFKLKDGEVGQGEYIDEFVFSPHSDKLAAVYMFENIKFNTMIDGVVA